MSRFNGQIGFIEPQLATLVDQPLNIVVIAGLTLALVACVSSDERGQQVAADHKTCLNEGEPGSTGYQNCRGDSWSPAGRRLASANRNAPSMTNK
jgi:hypothetical protein